MWDIESRRALLIRDVVILENIFRFNEENYIIPEPILFIFKDGKEVKEKDLVELKNKESELQALILP